MPARKKATHNVARQRRAKRRKNALPKSKRLERRQKRQHLSPSEWCVSPSSPYLRQANAFDKRRKNTRHVIRLLFLPTNAAAWLCAARMPVVCLSTDLNLTRMAFVAGFENKKMKYLVFFSIDILRRSEFRFVFVFF